MINVLTSHNHIWNPEKVSTDIIAEYLQHGQVRIRLNSEGPCADSVGLYNMLDYVCDRFQFDKKNIVIVTSNAEEQHPDYQIEIQPCHWIFNFVSAALKSGFVSQKDPAKNLFGCLYNIPSWERLCILSYLHRNSQHSNIVGCNGTWEPHNYNSYYLNSITDFCSTEFFNIADYIKTEPKSLTQLAHKPVTGPHMAELLPFYNDFFVDIVAETYTNGLTFFVTEKILRPMYAMTPFIAYGPQGFLDNLRSRYGFRTFSDFWDESYDDLQNYQRVQAIYTVLDKLDSLTMQQRWDMWQHMQPILQHNRRQLLIISKTHAAHGNSHNRSRPNQG